MKINMPMSLVKDAYNSISLTSLVKSTYTKLEIKTQELGSFTKRNKKALLAVATLTATVVGIYLYGSDLMNYIKNTCTRPNLPKSTDITLYKELKDFHAKSEPINPYPGNPYQGWTADDFLEFTEFLVHFDKEPPQDEIDELKRWAEREITL